MPAKDLYHDKVKNSLIKDDWKITHDPLRIRLARGKLDPTQEVIVRWIP